MDYITNVNKWYCCLNPAEKTAVDICAGNAGPLTYFVVAALIDGAFLLAYEGSGSPRKAVFVANWGLVYGTVPPDDPEGLGVYYLDVGIWDDINAYFDAEGHGCDDGCKIRDFTK